MHKRCSSVFLVLANISSFVVMQSIVEWKCWLPCINSACPWVSISVLHLRYEATNPLPRLTAFTLAVWVHRFFRHKRAKTRLVPWAPKFKTVIAEMEKCRHTKFRSRFHHCTLHIRPHTTQKKGLDVIGYSLCRSQVTISDTMESMDSTITTVNSVTWLIPHELKAQIMLLYMMSIARRGETHYAHADVLECTH